jgi:cobalamin biosynthesis protein CobD/CbiB
MLLTIIKKRQKMSNKDTLLEQAAISAAGLQQTHILGIFALLILIIVMFALLGLKKITWALLLLLNIVLFAYLMKLTVDGSMKETIIGPDGKIIENDDSEDEEDDEEEVVSPTSAENGAYENPNLPTLS